MLQFITHKNERIGYADGASMAMAGGCRWVQLRMKGSTDEEVIAVGIEVAAACRTVGATFIIDDRVHLVETLGADGVHLGKNDMPIDEARAILGSNSMIGATANTFEDLKRAWELGADYIGLGPFRFTTTKARLSPTLGLEGYRHIMGQCRIEGINIPVVAIGGIKPADIPDIMAAGVTGVALSGTILTADNPEAQTARIIEILNNK